MTPPVSAGILLYRRTPVLEVLLVKPGGPFWRNRDQGAWMIPKGHLESGETALEAAIREFAEETGTTLVAEPRPLCRVRQAGGKIVEAFAAEGDLDPAGLNSIEFELEWPPKSGSRQRFPEVEAARWMRLAEARRMMLTSQLPILTALERQLAGD